MKIALMGYGKMGRAVEDVALRRGHVVVARVDPALEGADVHAAAHPGGLAAADVAVDFSVGTSVFRHVEMAADAGMNVVVGTTDWKDDEEEVKAVVEESGIAFLHGPNFSLGAHLFYRLAEVAAELGGAVGGYDTHVLEAHHRHKVDFPSGTARHLADRLVRVLRDKNRWRSGPVGPDETDVLEVTSIRAGEQPGLHLVGLDGPDDRIEMRHEARGRTGFARGAVDAAEWLEGKRGFFTIDDMVDDRFHISPPNERER